MAQLIACATCARHLWSTELRCPFCGAANAGALPSGRGPRSIVIRAAGLAAAVAVASCGGKVDEGGGVLSTEDASADVKPDADGGQDAKDAPLVMDVVDVDVPEDWHTQPVYKGPPPWRA
ncbi:MAG: hypothetical protein HY898_31430 [Deltaproteobacteria bacterium]|nr:hypothetical protein [Deltaproteobacteria bacterium]